MSEIVRVEGISKSFEDAGGRLEVLHDLSFAVEEGTFFAITGASGVGKSTFLHILGLLDPPTTGEVYFRGERVTGLADHKLSAIRNREMGFVFQFHHLLPDFTALENVLMPRRITGRVGAGDRKRAAELLDLVRLQDRGAHLPSELSGGERQKVALARALMNRPRFLLADEPSGNLDEENKLALHRLFTDVNRDLGVTVAVVTHDLELAALAGERHVMHGGGISRA